MKLLLVLLSFSVWAFPPTPDTSNIPSLCSPADTDFLEYRYVNKIAVCKRNVTTSMRKQVYLDYNIPLAEQTNYTIDHLIPLFIGGTNSRYNLWPQHKSISTATIEGALYREVNAGKIHPNEVINKLMIIKYKKGE
jgi:hypothetical protein